MPPALFTSVIDYIKNNRKDIKTIRIDTHRRQQDHATFDRQKWLY